MQRVVTNTHLADVTVSGGFVAAQRFQLTPSATAADPGGPQQQYYAIYEVETESVEDIEEISAALVCG